MAYAANSRRRATELASRAVLIAASRRLILQDMDADVFLQNKFRESFTAEIADQIFAPFEQSAVDELKDTARCLDKLVRKEYYPNPFPSVACILPPADSDREANTAGSPTVPAVMQVRADTFRDLETRVPAVRR